MWAMCVANCFKLKKQITFFAVNVLLLKMSVGKFRPLYCHKIRVYAVVETVKTRTLPQFRVQLSETRVT